MGKHAQDERVVVVHEEVLTPEDLTTYPPTASVELVSVNEGVPTQVANPRRTSWRTAVQSVIGGLIALNAAIAVAAAFLAANSEAAAVVLGEWYGPVLAVVNGGVLVGSLVSKFVAQIMANPIVNEWITKHLPFLAPIKQVEDAELEYVE